MLKYRTFTPDNRAKSPPTLTVGFILNTLSRPFFEALALFLYIFRPLFSPF